MRLQREQSAETKQKISESLKGKAKSDQHKRAISEGLKRYWSTIPSKNNKLKNNIYDSDKKSKHKFKENE